MLERAAQPHTHLPPSTDKQLAQLRHDCKALQIQLRAKQGAVDKLNRDQRVKQEELDTREERREHVITQLRLKIKALEAGKASLQHQGSA